MHKWKDQIVKQIHLRGERVLGIGAGERSFISEWRCLSGEEQPGCRDAGILVARPAAAGRLALETAPKRQKLVEQEWA